MVNVYLIVSDLHLKETNFQGRVNYEKECDHAFKNLIDVIFKYKDLGHKVYLIFIGDLFHGSYKKVFKAIAAKDKFVLLGRNVDGMVSAIGNHEFSFYSDNPFWTLMSKIEAPSIRKILNKIWQPVGQMDTIRILDELIDGDVRFIFNHFGITTHQATVDGHINIGIFHQDLYAKEITDNISAEIGEDIFEHTPVYFDQSTVLYGYDHAIFGHNHMLYGQWNYVCDRTGYNTNLRYLSSLNRTNHREVNDKFLERNIPAVIIEDGKFSRIEDNKFTLMSREQCVNEKEVKIAQEYRALVKERKEIAERVSIHQDPIENIRATLVVNPSLLQLFDELLVSEYSTAEISVMKMLEEIL
jgi:hypothetical protein